VLSDCRVHKSAQIGAGSALDEADEVAKERCIDPLAAFVCRDPRELEQLVHVGLRELQRPGFLSGSRGGPVACASKPVVHGWSLDCARR
jgi:hypothetical protein